MAARPRPRGPVRLAAATRSGARKTRRGRPRRPPFPCACLRQDGFFAWEGGVRGTASAAAPTRAPYARDASWCFSKYETTTGAARDGTGTGTGTGRGRTRVVVRDGEVHAGLRLRRYGGVRHGGSRGGHNVAVARRGRRTSTDVTDEIGKAGTLPRRPPERAPHPSPSRVKTKRAARRGEHPGRLTTDDRLARASSCGGSRRRLPESARKLDIPRRKRTSARSALPKLFRSEALAEQLRAAGWRDRRLHDGARFVTRRIAANAENSFFSAAFPSNMPFPSRCLPDPPPRRGQ